MNLKMIILFLLIIVNISFADNIIDLYKKYLPERILSYPNLLQSENDKFEEYAELNPGLIYLYIKHLNEKYAPKVNPEMYNLTYGDFTWLYSISKNRKAIWRNNQLDIIDLIPNYLKRRKVSGFFDDDILPINPEDLLRDIKADQNKRDFFILLYLTQNKELEYSDTQDYTELVKAEYLKLIDSLTEQYTNAARTTDPDELIATAFKYSFLFKGSYLHDTPTTEFTIVGYIENFFAENYRVSRQFDVGIIFDDRSIDLTQKFVYNDIWGNTLSGRTPKLNDKLLLYGGYLFPLKEERSIFAFINFRVGISIVNSGLQKDEVLIWKGIRGINNLMVRGDLLLTNIKVKNMFISVIDISTPLFYITKDLYIESGVSYSFQQASFEADFYFDGVINNSGGFDVSFYDSHKEKYDKSRHLFYANAGLIYNIFSNLDLQVRYLSDSHINMGMRFRFDY